MCIRDRFRTSPFASNMTRDTLNKFHTTPSPLGAAKSRVFQLEKMVKSHFLTFWVSFLGIDIDEKFWKKSQVLSLIGSTNCMKFKNFHWNQHKLKNNNEIAKSWNFKWPKKSLPDVIRKIDAWGIVLLVANYPNRWESLKGQNFSFCNTV